MALAIVHSRAALGIEAPLVTVEVHLANGLPAFNIVGLPETVVKESRERVRSAILNAQLDFPLRRITVNLAPADLPKSGGRFDLAIALGILVASKQLPATAVVGREFMGELALSGEVRRVSGLLPGLIACRRERRTCIVPAGNAGEAGLLDGADIQLCGHLLELLDGLSGERELPRPAPVQAQPVRVPDLADVIGQDSAKRALLVAAAGGHNLLLRGPPGTGKTMLASRMAGILPPLTEQQALEVAALQSLSRGGVDPQTWRNVPFRAPHHTCSAVALVGGGSTLHAGEISLAHHGLLFLDELPEFSAKVLDVLREPLEAGEVSISRARYQVRLPARFQLVAAMNPCPCGHHGDPQRECRCTPDRVRQYRQRVSGPLLDRIDLQVEVPRLSEVEQVRWRRECGGTGPDSNGLRERVIACRALQQARAGCCNAHLPQPLLQKVCVLDAEEQRLLDDAMQRLQLSLRAYFRILKIARTIADLDGVEAIAAPQLLEAINYRRFDGAAG